MESENRKRTLGSVDGPQAKKPWMDKQNFNSQHKPPFPKKNHYVNTKLEVRKIPRELNNITKLNEHFSKFGTIVNIQCEPAFICEEHRAPVANWPILMFSGKCQASCAVLGCEHNPHLWTSGPHTILMESVSNRLCRHMNICGLLEVILQGSSRAPPVPTCTKAEVVFGGDPEAALIQYTANEEARRAISSTEAVLNNRFIRVYWHREPTVPTQEQGPIQSTSLGPQHSATHKVINKQHTAGAYVLNKTFTKHPASTGTGPAGSLDTVSPSAVPESSSAVTPASNLQKGPYSRTVVKPPPKALGKAVKALEAQEVLKKKQEALKLQQDMRKKKQEMLEKQIECQKVLIARLEKNRGMKPEERANIMKTLKELTEKISQLKNEISPASQSAANTTQAKTKADPVQLTAGEDTTDLKRRLGQLQVEAKRLGLLPAGRAKPTLAPNRGRGRGRGRSVRGRGVGNHMVVDHRPRALAILGVTQEEKEELMPHFVKFGEIEELRDQDANSVVMTFKTRSEAENAANQGAKFKGRLLQISWYKPKTPSISTEPEEEESKEEVTTEPVSPFLLPEEEEDDDDDEDDEYESRSWRR
ncbi:hypothetical protein NFI96_033671 [Prochilodus magdalenae]|nr:hypothetical protein NFI96_033671 [Prochilodus magdalenae]